MLPLSIRPGALVATLAATAAVVSAAAVQAPPSSAQSGCLPRFAWEEAQLTDADVAGAADAALFGFDADPDAEPDAALNKKRPPRPRCKVFPGDEAWPSQAAWDRLNRTLGGALIQTVPLAAPCYNNWPQQRDAAKCQLLNESWADPHLHVEDPTSAMFPLYQGRTCMPTSDPTQNCTLGGYASYSVAATKVSHIQLALNFARNTNIRLAVKNTGHDFADKSIGAGALSVWTHKLSDIDFHPDYQCDGYSGPAFKLGSGVETEDVYRAAEQHNVTVVGGECRTVGLAGGYIAGGGHSPLSSLVGMGADQVLSLDVVLPNGRYVTANARTNPDLFWALRGGGGSTYGVVTSVTIRAYPKMPITTMAFAFTTSANVSADTFWAGMGRFFSYFDAYTAAGAYSYFLTVPTGPGQFLFQFMPMWANNMTKPQFTSMVTPFLNDLASLGISVTPNITEYPSFYSAYTGTFPPERVGATDSHAASRLFPKENFQPAKLNETVAAVRYVVESGGALIGYNIRAAPNPTVNQANSVLPAWREATGFFILGLGWPAGTSDAEIASLSETMTTDWMERWRAVTPGSGSYMSEGDINEPDFQQAFYGEHYPRLRALKKKYDPTDLFYAVTAVGSEDWYVTDQVPWIPTQNGRLCRKNGDE